MDFSSILRILQVALGIGLVIFVHELGHFLAARRCGVRVEVFSLGFGPKLFAWRRGATTYQLAMIPLGGFVKMAGEEGAASGDEPLPDELPAKSVGQRFFIYSGGVLMNVIFALIVFPAILFHGVPFPEPVIGSVGPGGPAWLAGIEPGTRVLEVDGHPVFSFDSLLSEIALADEAEISLEIQAPGETTPRLVRAQPSYHETLGFKTLEIQMAADPQGKVVVEPGTPAHEAGLRTDDRIVAVDGVREDWMRVFDQRIDRSEPLTLSIERDGVAPDDGGALEIVVTPRIPEIKKKRAMLGVARVVDRVRAVREGPHTAPLGLQVEDRVLAVDEQTIVEPGDFEAALLAAAGRPFTILIEREDREMTLAVPALDLAAAAAAARDVAVVGDDESTRLAVQPGGAAEQAGVRSGDRMVRLGDRTVKVWQDILLTSKELGRPGEPIDVHVQRRTPGGTLDSLEFRVVLDTFALPSYGVALQPAMYVYRAHSAKEAVRIGALSSWKFLADTWSTLRGIFRGSVSGDNLGGIISISRISYDWAGMGLAKLLFFLCILSLNLAFLNVLPIPVLDGGHLFFLLVEKIKGSPVNERVLGYSQMVGLVLILGLVVFVTFNDLRKLLQ